ncbi:hypothetical protein B0I27_101240 [Arcticibacter pallidicorallinus]|uniref:Uncharacterized protein n=1 Tax=Arcticibacter pallidicorallinus TaxID=1259464 RepID=A0A2T0UBE9_9SPHI|nr:hypothetical protein [Arcticibacter pallidicorallinus]PRY55271.1 hypothetical protein B0I27_101240 [Arcticibacter pallidicorallinus]
MAKVDKKGIVRGTAGSVVYRGYRELNIIQGKPRKFEQTSASIRASTEFGLSSTTAAVIRQAFEPAYVHRDGEAVSRSTQLVYRGLRGSLTGSVGQRDLHDADLESLIGMDFNIKSRLSEVLQVSQRVERDEEGRLSVFMGALNAKTDLKVPLSISKPVSKYRLRFSLIGFNFRKEYYEYLEVKDLEFRWQAQLEAREIRFETLPEPDQLLMLSVSLLAYSETRMEEGYVLLNSKEFSPCAIIAAFHAEEPGEYPARPVNMELNEAQQTRGASIHNMCYEGNRLLRDQERRSLKMLAKTTTITTKRLPKEDENKVHFQPGKRVSFSSRS